MSGVSFNADTLAVLAITSITVLFYLYNYLTEYKVLLEFIDRVIQSSHSYQSIQFLIEKSSGILMLGIIPIIFFAGILDIMPARIGLTVGQTTQFWYLIFLLPATAGLLSFISARSKKNQSISPQMRIKNWHLRHILLSAFCWLIYLFGYEFFFRGILWFLCLNAFGFWPALAINISIYSLVHLPKGIFMTIGAIPLGILFCLLTYYTGSFYLAFLTHASMTITNEMFSIYYNPEFHFITRGNQKVK